MSDDADADQDRALALQARIEAGECCSQCGLSWDICECGLEEDG